MIEDYDYKVETRVRTLDPRTCSLVEVLDFLDEYLCVGKERVDCTYILSALRGPDKSEYKELKSTTTVHIRASAFPKLAAKAVALYSDINFWQIRSDKPYIGPTDSGHFAMHIREAAYILTRISRLRDAPRHTRPIN